MVYVIRGKEKYTFFFGGGTIFPKIISFNPFCTAKCLFVLKSFVCFFEGEGRTNGVEEQFSLASALLNAYLS